MDKSSNRDVNYRERVLPGWSAFLPLLLIFPTFWLAFAPINLFAGIASGSIITLVAVLFMFFNASVIRIGNGEIAVGKARIPVGLVGAIEIAPKGPRLAARIPNLDANAYLALQNSVKGLLKMDITDKNDPTPYWVFSSRSPDKVIRAVEQAKSAVAKARV